MKTSGPSSRLLVLATVRVSLYSIVVFQIIAEISPFSIDLANLIRIRRRPRNSPARRPSVSLQPSCYWSGARSTSAYGLTCRSRHLACSLGGPENEQAFCERTDTTNAMVIKKQIPVIRNVTILKPPRQTPYLARSLRTYSCQRGQKMRTVLGEAAVGVGNADYMTTLQDWLDVQNGKMTFPPDMYDSTPRYIRNMRDIGEYVHVDAPLRGVSQRLLDSARNDGSSGRRQSV